MIFETALSQTAFLLFFIVVGYIMSKRCIVPDNAQVVLSKLENNLFIPALVLGTFIDQFTIDKLAPAFELLVFSLVLEIIMITISVPLVRVCGRDRYERNIFLYGLCFSNFGFMGNAVVSALFPEIFLEYLIFTLPLWTLIYLWGVPALLMEHEDKHPTLRSRLKNFDNPMFFCMIGGMLIGLLQIPIPAFLRSAITSAGSCMSPIAMLLTGMTIAQFKLKEVLFNPRVYVITVIRLIVFPLAFVGVLTVLPLTNTFAVCAICALAMPLGLNTIIIPSAYGKDVRVASGMALISHVFSCATIPIVLWLFEWVR